MVCGSNGAWNVVEQELMGARLRRPPSEAELEAAPSYRVTWLAIRGHRVLLLLGRLLLTLGHRLEGYATVALATERH